MTTLPQYSTVQQEAEAAMQAVVDQLPPGTTVDDHSDDSPFACSDGGFFFTGHWAADPGDGFDIESFISTLPDELGGDFVVIEPALKPTFPQVELNATDLGNTTVTVSQGFNEMAHVVDILAMSRCAEDPDAE